MSTPDYAAAFVRLHNDLSGDECATYEHAVEGWDAPDADHLYRFAYLYHEDEDAPPSVSTYWSLDKAQQSAREDVYDPNSRWPVAILDLQDEVVYRVNVRVTFDLDTSASEVAA